MWGGQSWQQPPFKAAFCVNVRTFSSAGTAKNEGASRVYFATIKTGVGTSADAARRSAYATMDPIPCRHRKKPRDIGPRLITPLLADHRFPRDACSRSIASNSALKLP